MSVIENAIKRLQASREGAEARERPANPAAARRAEPPAVPSGRVLTFDLDALSAGGLSYAWRPD